MTTVVEVAVALVWREGRLLVARRRPGTHLAGLWELPGGKLLPGETPEACAEREVREEVGLGCEARARRETIRHEYPDRLVVLHPVDCDAGPGEPRPIEVDDVRWISPTELDTYPMPAANAPLVASLKAAPSP